MAARAKVAAKKIILHEDDKVTLENGRVGRVLELGSRRFCIVYTDGKGGAPEWFANSNVVKVGYMGRHHAKRVQQRTKLRSYRQWRVALRRHGWKAMVRHPHHYVVAGGLTLVLVCFGHYEMMTHTANWLYAVLENLSTLEAE